MISIKKEIKSIAENTWCVSDYFLDNYYLVAGDDTAVLIDTGCGIGNAMDEARELTNLPVQVLLTHGHLDHCGGMFSFDTCYMHPDDDQVSKEHYGKNDIRKWYINTRVPVRFPGEGHAEAMIEQLPEVDNQPIFSYEPIEDGYVWDLGGRTLEAIHTPGHSAGSVCFLDIKARILFSGDTVSNSNIIFNKPEGTEKELRIYRDSITKIWSHEKDFDQLAIGHDGTLIHKSIIKDYLYIADGVLDGSIVGQYEESGFRKGVVTRHGAAELWYRCDE